MIASLATRALAFISIPVYTNLLSENDYGIIAIFFGLVSVFSTLLTLNCDTAVHRYFFDKKSNTDFKQFVGTTTMLCLIIIIVNSIIILSFAQQIADIVELPLITIKLLLPLVIINIIGLLFAQIYQPQKLSKPIAKSSLTRVYLGFIVSISIILMLSTDKYLGQILGQIIAGMAMIVYWVIKISPFFSLAFKKKHIKYILSFSIPLMPYMLSGVIVDQFGKIAIGHDLGPSEAGFYALAISISSLTAILTEVTNQAWFPYYIEYMQAKDYQSHDNDLKRILKISSLFGLVIACFGYEIGSILANKNFTSALYLVPILVIGYLFHQIAYAYFRNFVFAKKTGYMSIIIILAGCTTILLNILFIPKYGINGAAVSVVLSYVLMAVLAYLSSKYVIKVHSIRISELLKPAMVVVFGTVPLYYIQFIDSYGLVLLCKIMLFISLGYIVIRSEIVYIRTFIHEIFKKK